MKEFISEKIKDLLEQVEELEEYYGKDFEDFNAMDASGGNFDDAYYMGSEHGEIFGQLNLLNELLKKLNESGEE